MKRPRSGAIPFSAEITASPAWPSMRESASMPFWNLASGAQDMVISGMKFSLRSSNTSLAAKTPFKAAGKGGVEKELCDRFDDFSAGASDIERRGDVEFQLWPRIAQRGQSSHGNQLPVAVAQVRPLVDFAIHETDGQSPKIGANVRHGSNDRRIACCLDSAQAFQPKLIGAVICFVKWLVHAQTIRIYILLDQCLIY